MPVASSTGVMGVRRGFYWRSILPGGRHKATGRTGGRAPDVQRGSEIGGKGEGIGREAPDPDCRLT
jgi:hypothetical protein